MGHKNLTQQTIKKKTRRRVEVSPEIYDEIQSLVRDSNVTSMKDALEVCVRSYLDFFREAEACPLEKQIRQTRQLAGVGLHLASSIEELKQLKVIGRTYNTRQGIDIIETAHRKVGK
jgi:hypothetical protein